MDSVYWYRVESFTRQDHGVPVTSLHLTGYSWNAARPSQRRLVEWQIPGPHFTKLYFCVLVQPNTTHHVAWPDDIEGFTVETVGFVCRIHRQNEQPKIAHVPGIGISDHPHTWRVWYCISDIPIGFVFTSEVAQALRRHVTRCVSEIEADNGVESSATSKIEFPGFPPLSGTAVPLDPHESLLRCVASTARVPGVYEYGQVVPELGTVTSDSAAAYIPCLHVFNSLERAMHLLAFESVPGGPQGDLLLLQQRAVVQRLSYAILVPSPQDKSKIHQIITRSFTSLKEEIAWSATEPDKMMSFEDSVGWMVQNAAACRVVIVALGDTNFPKDVVLLAPFMSDRGGQRTLHQIWELCSGAAPTTATASGSALPSVFRSPQVTAMIWCPCSQKGVVYDEAIRTAQFMSQVAQTTLSRSLMFLLWKHAPLKYANAVLLKRFVREGYDVLPWHDVNASLHDPGAALPESNRTGGGNSVTHKGVYFADPGVSSIVEIDAGSYYPSIAAEKSLCVCMPASESAKSAQQASRLSSLQHPDETDEAFAERVVQMMSAQAPSTSATANASDAGSAAAPWVPSTPTAREFAFLVKSRATFRQAENGIGAEALKLLANALYGNLKVKHMRFQNTRIADFITFMGRRYIVFFREVFIRIFNAKLIASITDSVILRTGGSPEWTGEAVFSTITRLTQEILGLQFLRFNRPKMYAAYMVFATNRTCSLSLGQQRVQIHNVSGGVVKQKAEQPTGVQQKYWLDFYTYALTRDAASMENFLTKTSHQDLAARAVAASKDAAVMVQAVFPSLVRHLHSGALLHLASLTSEDAMDCDEPLPDPSASSNPKRVAPNVLPVWNRPYQVHGFTGNSPGVTTPWYLNSAGLREFLGKK